MRAQEKTRLASVPAVARKDVEQHIAWLDKRITKLKADLGARLKTSEVWCRKAAVLDSVPGVGEVTTFSLPADLPKLGTLIRRKIARGWLRFRMAAASGRGSSTFVADGPRFDVCYTCLHCRQPRIIRLSRPCSNA
jgi:hypothetical protein